MKMHLREECIATEQSHVARVFDAHVWCTRTLRAHAYMQTHILRRAALDSLDAEGEGTGESGGGEAQLMDVDDGQSLGVPMEVRFDVFINVC